MSLRSGKRITRYSYDRVPMPDTVIARVNKLGKDQPTHLTFLDRKGNVIGDVEPPGVGNDNGVVDTSQNFDNASAGHTIEEFDLESTDESDDEPNPMDEPPSVEPVEAPNIQPIGAVTPAANAPIRAEPKIEPATAPHPAPAPVADSTPAQPTGVRRSGRIRQQTKQLNIPSFKGKSYDVAAASVGATPVQHPDAHFATLGDALEAEPDVVSAIMTQLSLKAGLKRWKDKGYKAAYAKMIKEQIDIPMYIGGKKVTTKKKQSVHPPHQIKTTIGQFSIGSKKHVKDAIDAALAAKDAWANLPWEDRAAIFLRAADLLSGPFRAKMNAATMLAQSKNIYQAEIDAVAEMADFFRFNVQYMAEMYSTQPESNPGMWNRLEYRPLEGFIFALTPFNFTSIAANLCAAPAMLGNTIVWKPADSQVYSANVIMELFEAAGLPPGVINLVYVDGPAAGDVIFNHPEFAGLHFTGSTGVFRTLWKNIGNNIEKYRSYPRIVGETGGKDFVVAHASANPEQVATALARGAFEFQGQKCSAASRAYIPKSIWKATEKHLLKQVKSFNMGGPEDFRNFINAVIDERAFDKITSYIEGAKKDKKVKIIAGGGSDKKKGYFIEPTIILTQDPKSTTMCEEIFGPVLSIYVYDDKEYEEILSVVDDTSPYALTGSIMSNDRYATKLAVEKLRNAAGNFYINDKPTGAVVGQQPFGGARGSGTNDKAGSILNLYRWVSPRTMKETFDPPSDYKYPFLGAK